MTCQGNVPSRFTAKSQTPLIFRRGHSLYRRAKHEIFKHEVLQGEAFPGHHTGPRATGRTEVGPGEQPVSAKPTAEQDGGFILHETSSPQGRSALPQPGEETGPHQRGSESEHSRNQGSSRPKPGSTRREQVSTGTHLRAGPEIPP